MKFTTFTYKRQILDSTSSEKKIQMNQPSLQLKREAKVIARHVVREDEEMRLDIISSLYYGNADGVDIIMKFNAISNPFSIKAGQTLLIPDAKSVGRFITQMKRVSNNPRTQFTDTRRMSQQDQKRKKFLEEKSQSKPNGSKEKLPPNMLKSDENSKELRSGRIILGANIKTNNRNRL